MLMERQISGVRLYGMFTSIIVNPEKTNKWADELLEIASVMKEAAAKFSTWEDEKSDRSQVEG